MDKINVDFDHVIMLKMHILFIDNSLFGYFLWNSLTSFDELDKCNVGF